MPIRVRQQRVKRAEHVQRVCSFLAKPLRSEEHQKRIHGTNRLFPHGSLNVKPFGVCLVDGSENIMAKEKDVFSQKHLPKMFVWN